MPLIPPSLDDRSYNDLVQDLIANIPAHTPEWTNPQPGDPGRTLLELFAWLADTILYRANLIPERQRIAFLRLLGQTMKPAAAATGLVTLQLGPAVTSAVKIAAQATVSGQVNFETLGEISLLPVLGQVYIKRNLSQDQLDTTLKLRTGLKKLYGLSTVPSGYTTTPVFANNQVNPDGLDVLNGTADGSVWIALLAPTKQTQAAVKAALNASGQQLLNVGFAPPASVPGLYAVPQSYTGVGQPAQVPAAWQMTQDSPNPNLNLKVFSDTTNGLTQAGVVQLGIPGGQIGAPGNDVRSDPQAGVGPKPPRIDDSAIAARLVSWVQLTVQSELIAGWMGVNAVQIDQRTTFKSIVIGVSDGSANQQFSTGKQSVDPTTFQLNVDMPGLGYRPWMQVDDLLPVQGPLSVYKLDPEAGTVTFGNQLQGMIVPAGRRIQVAAMRAGGGIAGNLPAGSLKGIQAFDPSGNQVTQSITVQQPLPTQGGAEAETLQDAEQRIPSLLQNQSRAVTASDYQNLAMQTPGVSIGRVEVLPLFKPQTHFSPAPGVVSVMVIPSLAGVMNPSPRASQTMLQTVYQYLSPCRPVSVELYVIASEYVGLAITVGLEVKDGYQTMQVAQKVENALRSYMWPLAPGGMDGSGWQLGRTVRQMELEVIVSNVAGVSEVNGLNLFSVLPTAAYRLVGPDSSGSQQIVLSSWQLPELLDVVVIASPDGTSSTAPSTMTQNASTAGQPVPVPVVPNVC